MGTHSRSSQATQRVPRVVVREGLPEVLMSPLGPERSVGVGPVERRRDTGESSP